MDNLVSIIVPVYNAGDYIEETIKMVCSQTYGSWELILVDDGSTDDGREKIRAQMEKDKRIRLIVKEKNGGAAAARNAGVDAAQGRYLAYLDADDVWRPQKLMRELEFMKEQKAGFVFTAYEFGDEQGKGTGKLVKVPRTLTYRQALSRTVIFTSTVLFDTEKTGKELLKMPEVESEDTAAWWRILRNGHTAYGLNEVLTIYRRPGKSLSSNKLKAMQRIWNLYRREEKLSLPYSLCQFVFWAFRATARRI